MESRNEKGQVLIEGLVAMMCLVSVLLILTSFLKKQNEVFKKYELPAKIQYQNR